MPDAILIADELLAEVLDAPGDRVAVDSVLNRPDPFENMWNELRSLENN